MGSPASRLTEALDREAAILERAAERVEELPFGRARFHSGVPRWLDLNAVRVHGPLDPAEVERIQADLPHRRVELLDPALLELFGPEWQRDELLWMGWDGGEPPAPAHPVQEVSYDEVEPLREEWVRSEPWAAGDERLIAQVLEADRITFGATPTRAFTAGGDAYGLLAGGLVHDVYTTPSARGRGVASAVVAKIMAAAGPGPLYLPTDADGRARLMYERLGFRALGVVHRLLRFP